MRKTLLLLIASVIVSVLHAQEETQKNEELSAEDSVCLKKAYSMIREMRADSSKQKPHYDSSFLVTLSRTKSPTKKTRIRVLNLGADKVISFSVLEVKVSGVDSSGTASTTMITSNIEFLKDQSLQHCESFSIDISKFTMPVYVSSDIEQVKIKLVFNDKEIIGVIGREE